VREGVNIQIEKHCVLMKNGINDLLQHAPQLIVYTRVSSVVRTHAQLNGLFEQIENMV
jgi:hypothetical protein